MRLAYTLRLYPSHTKADTLANLASLFRRAHTERTLQIVSMEGVRCSSTKGLGEFIGCAYRRASIDYRRTAKAGHMLGTLKAELIDSAEVQQPRKARWFDWWITVRGATMTPGRPGGFYIPAKRLIMRSCIVTSFL